jgi:putative DNA primase/helicase
MEVLQMLADTSRAVDALHAIPPTIDHDTRARVGMAAKDAGVTFADYDAWQSTNPRYNAIEVRSMWQSYDDGPVKAGTLYRIAAEHGWRINGNTKPKTGPEKISKPAEPPRKPAPGMGAAGVWEPLPARNESAPVHCSEASRRGAVGSLARGA